MVAIDPSAAFRKVLRMWFPRTAVSVDASHLVMLANAVVTEGRQRLTQENKDRRRRAADSVWANRRLLLSVSHPGVGWDRRWNAVFPQLEDIYWAHAVRVRRDGQRKVDLASDVIIHAQLDIR